MIDKILILNRRAKLLCTWPLPEVIPNVFDVFWKLEPKLMSEIRYALKFQNKIKGF
jgi:hypothetical protein